MFIAIYIIIIIVIIIIIAHQHKAAGRKTRLDIQNYGCNGNLLCGHGVVERNRISSLQSRGKALEKECCLPGVFCDSGDTPANLLCELNGHLIIIIIIIIMQRLTRHVSVISIAIYMLRTGFRLNNDAAKCSDIT